MKHWLTTPFAKLYILVVAVILGLALFHYAQHSTAEAKINGHVIPLEVAVTAEEKQKGLGDRDSLAPGHGMLFPYDHKEQYSFWMKDMRFPIDIVWIEDQTVADISENVQPPKTAGEKLPIYSPRIPINKVLELPAGTVKEYSIHIGDLFQILH